MTTRTLGGIGRRTIVTAALSAIIVTSMGMGLPADTAMAKEKGTETSSVLKTADQIAPPTLDITSEQSGIGTTDATVTLTGKTETRTDVSIVPVRFYIILDTSGSIDWGSEYPAAKAFAQDMLTADSGNEICFVPDSGGQESLNCVSSADGITSTVPSGNYGSDDHWAKMNHAISVIRAQTDEKKPVLIQFGDNNDGTSSGSGSEDSWGLGGYATIKNKLEFDAYIVGFRSGSSGQSAADQAGLDYYYGGNTNALTDALKDIGSKSSTTIIHQQNPEIVLTGADTTLPVSVDDITVEVEGATESVTPTVTVDEETNTIRISAPGHVMADGETWTVHVRNMQTSGLGVDEDIPLFSSMSVSYNPSTEDGVSAGDVQTTEEDVENIVTPGLAVISLDANGGKGEAEPLNLPEGSTIPTESLPDDWTRDGYEMTGWNTSADGSGTSVTETTVTDDITLYAQWNALPSSITYDANGGKGSTTPTDGVTDKTVKTADSMFTRDGYTFTGWNTKKDGTGDAYAENTDLKLPADGLTLYAQWNANPSTIRYRANGGEGLTTATTGVTDQRTSLADNAFTRDGYTFTGWNTKKDGTGDAYEAGSAFTLPPDGLTLYAQWTADESILDFDSNKGEGEMSPIRGHTDDTVTVGENLFTRTGWSFTGWNSSTDGTGMHVIDQGPVRLPAGGLTLHAQWAANRADVEYSANGGKGTMSPTIAVTGDRIMIQDNAFARDGYTFTGWNTMPDGTGDAYEERQTLDAPAGGLTLHAQWHADGANVSYQANGGEGSMPDTVGVTDGQAMLADSMFTRDGYTFTGWNTKRDGSGVGYAPGSTLTLPADGIILYAQWTANRSVIVYQANGGEGSMPDTEGVTDGMGTIASGLFARDGYAFAGWNTAADGSGMAYTPGQSLPMPAGVLVLYAQWVASDSRITYEANGGQGETNPTEGVTDMTVQAADGSALHRDGYAFAGWTTDAENLGEPILPGDDVILPAGGLTLYAKWRALPVQVTYDPNADGVTGETGTSASVTDGEATVKENGYTRDGYTFTGWNTKPDGTGDAYMPDDMIPTPTDGIILYAQWKADAASVTFDMNGRNTDAPASLTGVTDDRKTLPDMDADCADLAAWTTGRDGSGDRYRPGDEIILHGNVTLYAQWDDSSCTMAETGVGFRPLALLAGLASLLAAGAALAWRRIRG